MIAYVLAGGRGSRLQPWHAPKCLLPVRGVSMLQRSLNHLRASERVDHIVVCTGYRHEDVVAAIREHGWQEGYVSVSRQAEDASMGERLWHAFMAGRMHERSLIVYADELVDVDIKKLVISHEALRGRVMTFAATYASAVGGIVEETATGPKIIEDRQHLINIGYVVADPEAWRHLGKDMGVSDWINQVRDRIGDVGLYYHQGRRATVNSLADLARAEEVWR